ncbi:MAG: 50S ribosomal protein L22 [Patescibacteria group bacterium]|nr:50S ribosomal protein L22 [Patescibacteria group bacterium]
MITASLKNHRISPRKVRLVADMIRGKSVSQAEAILGVASKKAKSPLADLLRSAVSNASHNHSIDKGMLFIKEIRVDKGYTLKRFMPVSRGSAHPIKKRTSHVSIVLAPVEQPKSAKAAKPAAKKKAAAK